MSKLAKFIPFSKVNAVLREVSGIVTAEQPDKDNEVCAYEESKPYYKAVIEEIGKATEGKNFFPLRQMHQLSAVGKCIGFHFDDTDKEIEMTFKVVDDDAWKKVDERVYTGFSQGGRKVGDQVEDPVYKGCMRYVADPSEISLVDNPCLPAAHFAYVKSDGSVEMRKFLKTEVPQADARIAALEEQVTLLKAAGSPKAAATASDPSAKQEKTKRVGGKDLPASSFAHTPDLEKTDTWQFPLHTDSYVRVAIAQYNHMKSISSSDKPKVRAKIAAAAKNFKIDIASEQEKIAAIGATLRKAVRIYINKNAANIVSSRLLSLDSDLGKLNKGMYEVSNMACMLDDLQRLIYSVCWEQDWEEDTESPLPEMLSQNIAAFAETFIAMVNEETKELIAEVRSHAAA